MIRSVDDRARVHAALGEPIRLAIVDELAVSDRSPTELAARFDLTSNLLAHHLDVLESAGVVERFASAGDGRRRYVRLKRSALTGLGPIRTGRSARRMLFVCSQNSARSQLAAALWTARTGSAASSAGTHPAARVHPGAVAAGRRAGLDLSDAVPEQLELGDDDVLVVTVCDRAHEELDAPLDWWHWSIPDPVTSTEPDAFDATVAQLDDRIRSVTD